MSTPPREFVTQVQMAGSSWHEDLVAKFLAEVGLTGRVHGWGTSWAGHRQEGPVEARLSVLAVSKKTAFGKEVMELSINADYWAEGKPVAWTRRGTVRLMDAQWKPVPLDELWRDRVKPFRKPVPDSPPWERDAPPVTVPQGLAITPSGDLAMVTMRLGHQGRTAVARVVRVATGEVVAQKKMERVWPSVVAASGDLLVAGGVKTLWVFDRATGEQTNLKAGRQQTQVVCVSPNGKRIAAGCGANYTPFDFNVRIWSGATLEHTLKGHEAIVVGLGFVSDDRLVSIDLDFVACVWDVASGALVDVERMPGRWRASAGTIHYGVSAWTVGGDRVLAHDGKTLKLFRLGGDRIDAERTDAARVAVSRSGRFALVHPSTGPVQILADLHRGELNVHQLVEAPPESVVAFGPDDTVVVWSPQGLQTHAIRPLAEPGAPGTYVPKAREADSKEGPAASDVDAKAVLLKRGIAIEPRSMFSYLSDLAVLELLLKAGVSANAAYPPGGSHAGARILEWAVGRDDYKAAKLLLEHGADPDLASSYTSDADAPGRKVPLIETTNRKMRALLQKHTKQGCVMARG